MGNQTLTKGEKNQVITAAVEYAATVIHNALMYVEAKSGRVESKVTVAGVEYEFKMSKVVPVDGAPTA